MKSDLRQIVIATSNAHKLREILDILTGLPVQILSLQDFPEISPVEETGKSFHENALLKALTVYQKAALLTLADDSGLEVDALEGAPGIYSARFAGKERDYQANNHKLLEELQTVPDAQRGAQFRCVVSLVGPSIEKFSEGIVRGHIIRELRGEGGFGYDPLFVPEGFSETYAELGQEIKNKISHRAIAFQNARILLEEILKLK